MDAARVRLGQVIGRSDPDNRFRIYTPVTKGADDIYVHAKVFVADDRLLRVGSSNLNNRSMGFDTECDLGIEAATSEHRRAIAEAIRKAAAKNGVPVDAIHEVRVLDPYFYH